MFTSQEINILLEALVAWESQETTGSLLASVLGIGLAGPDYKPEADKMMDEAIIERKRRERASIRIKAKLLDLQDNNASVDLFQKVVVNGEES